MVLREARPTDIDTIVDFNALLAEESEGVVLDRDRLREGVSALLDDPAKGLYFIAEDDDRPVGQVGVTFEWSDWRNGVFWWLQSVYVRPEYRRHGVLRALYGRVRELAAESGVCGVRLYVERENLTAIAAYRRLGLARTSYHMYETDFVLDREPRP